MIQAEGDRVRSCTVLAVTSAQTAPGGSERLASRAFVRHASRGGVPRTEHADACSTDLGDPRLRGEDS